MEGFFAAVAAAEQAGTATPELVASVALGRR
jgi:hypothetical protein